jgi:hypothetical protein
LVGLVFIIVLQTSADCPLLGSFTLQFFFSGAIGARGTTADISFSSGKIFWPE